MPLSAPHADDSAPPPTAARAAAAAAMSEGGEPDDLKRCTLLGGPFALFVQAGLAATAIVTLVYKRQTERPRRAWTVWAFDASKQGFAGLLQHFVNLAFGVVFASQGRASECAWYLLNFTISVVCGVGILWAWMHAYRYVVERFRLKLLRSGEYGNPPNWKPWLAQLLLWGFMASAEKVLTAAVVIFPLHGALDVVAVWIEAPVRPYPHVELLLVMVCAPVVLNVFFFWVIDNIIMRRVIAKQSSEEWSQDDREPLLEGGCCCPSGRSS